MCYGGSGTCTTDPNLHFPYVREVAGQYATCTYSASASTTCVIPAASVCNSKGYSDMNPLTGVCTGTLICESDVTIPGCKP